MKPEPLVFQDRFRKVMANFAAGVTVVTSFAEDRHHGLTVSSFTSVSLDPPLVLVCIDHSTYSIKALRIARGFTVNMLREGTGDVALKFAAKDADKFAGLAVVEPEFDGAGLRLPEYSYACLECRTVQSLEMGDHTVFVGHAETAVLYETAPPLLYWQWGFRRLSDV